MREEDGLCRHADREGNFIHEGSFFDLDVFHKGFARARDEKGWFHVDRDGRDISGKRFAMLEPFYNGQALARGQDGTIMVIDEEMDVLVEIPSSVQERSHWYKDISVSYWEPFAMKLGLEAGLAGGKSSLKVTNDGMRALLRAWIDLGLLDATGNHMTERGSLLAPGHIERDLIDYWMGPQLIPWLDAVHRLEGGNVPDFFDEVSREARDVELTQRVLNHYAQHDWSGISNFIDLEGCRTIVDLAGGTGALMSELMQQAWMCKGIVFEYPEVAKFIASNDEFEVIGGDIFRDELPRADAYLLSRVLHDWDDARAVQILKRVADVARRGSPLFVIDRIGEGGEHGLLDLNMYLTNRGKERNRDEWVHIFDLAGWSLEHTQEFKGHAIFTLRLVR